MTSSTGISSVLAVDTPVSRGDDYVVLGLMHIFYFIFRSIHLMVYHHTYCFI